jgi:hypothetical protein
MEVGGSRMNAVTSIQLAIAKRILELLAVNAGESIDLAKLRDGSILIRKAEGGLSNE